MHSPYIMTVRWLSSVRTVAHVLLNTFLLLKQPMKESSLRFSTLRQTVGHSFVFVITVAEDTRITQYYPDIFEE